VLDVDALDDADPLGKLEQLRLGERLGRGEPSRTATSSTVANRWSAA
jgi:hypothetical protein